MHCWPRLLLAHSRIGTRQNRRRREYADVLLFIALLLLVMHSPALSAQQQPAPKPLRFDFTPFIGYRTSMSFPVEPHVTGTNPRVVLDANPSYGVSFGVRLREEEDLVEVRWARQDSYIHSEDITPQPPRKRVIRSSSLLKWLASSCPCFRTTLDLKAAQTSPTCLQAH